MDGGTSVQASRRTQSNPVLLKFFLNMTMALYHVKHTTSSVDVLHTDLHNVCEFCSWVSSQANCYCSVSVVIFYNTVPRGIKGQSNTYDMG